MNIFRRTLVLAGFPGVGKTYLYNHQSDLNLTVLDLDSSNFSWSEPGVRHPDFPNNYIEHIIENTGKYDAILISTHKAVRDELKNREIDYTIVMPVFEDKENYLQRFRDRGSPDEFINMMNENWDSFIADLLRERHPRVRIMYSDETLFEWIYRSHIYLPD